MSEGIESTASVPSATEINGAKAAGALIRKAREELGTHIGALAVALKVPVRKLEALEAGELEALSGPVFVRALASSVCRHLKIDPTQVLALLPQVVSVPFSQPPELKTPFRVPGEGTGPSVAARFLTMPVLAVLTLLVGALAVALWPSHDGQPEAESVAPNPARAVQVLPPSEVASASMSAPVSATDTGALGKPSSGATGPAPTNLAPGVPGAMASVATAAVSSPVIKASAAKPLSASSAASGPVATVSSPARSVSAPAPLAKVPAGAAVPGETSILQFKAKDQTWIEVVDAKGDAIVRRTLQAGEVATAAGVLPLRVVVGRIDATDVTVRGRKLDMTTISKDNVGRFEVAQ